jgi:hypothetical protein
MRYFFMIAMVLLLAPLSRAQERDHLTEKEVDLVRETQIIDARIDVFIKAADRRILVLTTPNATQKKKEEEMWGPLPAGSRAELLIDFRRILSEAMEKLDDSAERNRSNPRLSKALDKLKAAATRQIVALRALAPQMTEKREQRALLEAIDEADVASKGSLK